jgi:histidinol-phosphate phosphatase family protein
VKQAVILAGGAGTRLSSVTGTIPKALVDVAGVPLLGRQLAMLAGQGFDDVVVLSGHRANADAAARSQQIHDYCGDGSAWGIDVRCMDEPEARGTAGAVRHIIDHLAPLFAVLYGDTVMDVDLRRMETAHRAAQADATLFLHPNDHPHDSDLVEIDRGGAVRAFHAYPHAEGAELPNLVNAALYVLNRDALKSVLGLPLIADFGKHVFPHMLATGSKLHGYKSPEYIKDAGTPKRIEKVRRDIESGRVAERSFRNPAAAVFLDRDGVINEARGFISKPSDLDLIPGASIAVSYLNESKYRVICVTNQPVIARGEADWSDLDRIHARLDTLLGQDGGFLEDVLICPHHPDKGFAGERPDYKIDCDCRKPKTALIDRAVTAYNLDRSQCWMIGDRSGDIELARRAGLRSILVRTGDAGRDGQYDVSPDYVANDLADAVATIRRVAPDAFYTQPVKQDAAA